MLNIILKRIMRNSNSIYNKRSVFISHWLCRMKLTVSLIIIAIVGCQKEDINKKLVDSGFYKGTFEGHNLSILQDSVYLTISDGYYNCSTTLPFNFGAGIIEVSESRLKFTDTLFFPIPALYIAGFALSGEYNYHYDGVNLMLEKMTIRGKLTYTMEKVK